MKHTVLVRSSHHSQNGWEVRLVTDGGRNPGSLLVRTFRITERQSAEHFAYVLAKQIDADELKGVSKHTMGFWLAWRAAV